MFATATISEFVKLSVVMAVLGLLLLFVLASLIDTLRSRRMRSMPSITKPDGIEDLLHASHKRRMRILP